MAVYRWVDDAGEHYREVPAGEPRVNFGVPEDASTVGRMPGEFERHTGQAWVKDEEAQAQHKEDARLMGLSPSNRQQEAIERALERFKGGGPK